MTRTQLEILLAQYENQVGRGKMDNAALTLAEIIRGLADAVLPAADPVALSPRANGKTTLSVDIGDLPVEKAKEFLAELNPPPCEPCDVSIPNNPALIEEFKEPIVAPVEPATPEAPVEIVEEAAPAAAEPEAPVEETAAEEPAAVVTSPEGDAAPAPKTPPKKKP